MSPLSDDPRLTAYALGELSPSDRAAVEQQIGDSVETLLEIEAIREVASQLRAALQNEARVPRLTQPCAAENLKSQISNSKSQEAHTVGTVVAPVAVLIVKDAARRRKASGKFAVAASCLALMGAFGIVAITGRHDQRNAADFANASKPTVRHELEFEGIDGTSRSYTPLTAFSVLDVDVKAIGSGAAVRGTSGGQRAGEDASGRGSGSRQAMIVSGGGSTTSRERSKGPDEGAVRFKSDTTGSNMTRYYHVPNEPQVAQRLQFGVGVVEGGRGLPGNTTVENGTKLAKIRDEKLNRELEERLVERNPSVHRLQQLEESGAEAYAAIHDNPFATPLREPLSTFSIDVDTAAYSNMRRFLTQGSWPPADSVRIEELVNYFSYDYTPPGAEISNLKSQIPNQEAPFAVHMEVAACPWNAEHRLVRVGLKGNEIALDKRPVSNIVFLIDVSGSMQPANKLPLVKAGLRRLVEQFTENDRVGIVVYAGASGLALDSTNATQKDVILSAIENLQAGGSTNGGEGIQLAYALARKNFINKGTNRVILCTDGDFNVGVTNQNDLTRLIEEESKSGVFLSVLGFGMGNLKDSTLEKLADKGNGNYAYIDTLKEANKVFVEQMTGTLITIAKDVKIQIEFNPSQVGAYRLIGYENRLLAAQDFRDDTKDAGEIGAGHTVTALYEIIPPSKLPKAETPAAKSLKYQPNVPSPAGAPATDAAALRKYNPTTASADAPLVAGNAKNELLTIWLRYKQPDSDKSDAEFEQVLVDEGHSFANASIDFRWAASVASFGLILRSSPHKGNATLDSVLELAQSAIGADKSGYREEFVSLVRSAKALQPQPTK